MSPAVLRFIERQQLLIVVAVIVYAIFWAIGQPSPVSVTLIYSLCLGNVTLYLLDQLEFLYSQQRRAQFPWPTYLTLLLAITPLAVVLATTIVFWIDTRPGGGHFQVFPPWRLFWNYQRTSWKFPAIANLIVGIVLQTVLDYQTSFGAAQSRAPTNRAIGNGTTRTAGSRIAARAGNT